MQTTTFADLGLSPKVQAAIVDAGYTTPTPIQAAAIPVALTGQDVLGIAQTGTGKTASFTLPMISRLETGRARARMPRSLILAPTRELAAQVAQSFEKYGVNHKLNVALLIGGVSMDEQSRKLDRGVDVLIATPGRLIDHFQRGRVMLMGVEILVIDEADRMLDMGFIPDIEKICKLLPPKRQTLFFSATMPPEITRLVNQFMKSPERIEVAKPATTAKTITQRFRFCPEGEDWAKREVLREMIRNADLKNAIIFCNRKRDVAILQKSLSKHGFDAGALHGDMDQRSRTETLDKFRAGNLTLLAASDVAARGLDIPDVSHVFNFDLPWQSDDYVHRIGRTGRAGKEGAAFSLVTVDDLKLLTEIEKVTGDTVEWIGDPPSDDDREAGASKKRRRGGRSGKKDTATASRGKSAAAKDKDKQPAASADGGEKRSERRRTSSRRAAAKPTPETVIDTGTDTAVDASEPVSDKKPAAKSGRPSKRSEPAAPPKARRRSGASRVKVAEDGEAISAPAAGFADNIPAFLRRPVKRPGSKSAQSKPSDSASSTSEDAQHNERETETAAD